MKRSILILSILIGVINANAQSEKYQFATCFGKANKKSINNKMENFINRVSVETGCPASKITYTVDEYYTGFYSKKCKHLPKRISFDACGEKRTYKHNGLSGAVLYWLLGSWVSEKK